MRSSNTFGLHFVLRPAPKDLHAIYLRVVVNGTRCELALKQTIDKKDWNTDKGAARPKTPALKQLNGYLEEVRGKLVSHYQQLNLSAKGCLSIFVLILLGIRANGLIELRLEIGYF